MGESDIEVRAVESKEELERVDDFLRTVFQQHSQQSSWRGVDFYSPRFPAERELMQVAISADRRIVGAALANHDSPKYVTLGAIGIGEPLRRSGLGRRLVQAVEDAGRARGAIRLTLGSVDEAVGFYLDRGFTAVLLVQFLPHEVDSERRVKLALEGPLSGYEYVRRSYNDIPQLFVQLPEADFRLRDRVIEEVPGISAGFVMGKDL